jgi:hypothetical protein
MIGHPVHFAMKLMREPIIEPWSRIGNCPGPGNAAGIKAMLQGRRLDLRGINQKSRSA